jgi:beta-1,4-N-acetylglucosaminyltransferase
MPEPSAYYPLLGSAGLITAFAIRIATLLLSTNRRRQVPPKGEVVVLVVLGSGGHTAEMMQLTKGLLAERYRITYVLAASDKTSVGKVEALLGRVLHTHEVARIPRSREVGQSWLSSVLTTAHAAVWAFLLVARTRPSLVLANGPGTCLPICVAAFALRASGLLDNRVVFCESFCRVQSLSLTGKLLYPIADRFVVQWPQLTKRWGTEALPASRVDDNSLSFAGTLAPSTSECCADGTVEEQARPAAFRSSCWQMHRSRYCDQKHKE